MKKAATLLTLLLGLISAQVSGKWFEQKTVYSKALQQEKTYYVSLPKGYNALDTTTRYPVIVFLHSASITATEMVNTFEPFLDNFLGKLLFEKLFKVIFIIPDGSCEPYKGSFYTNSLLYGNYQDYIMGDMMEEIESKYHTFHQREKWSIMGHSMGGYGAMKMALQYPEKFIGVSSLSGPLNITYHDEILPILQSEHGNVAPYDFIYSGSVTKLLYSMAGAFSPDLLSATSIAFPVNTLGNIDLAVKEIWEPHNPINYIKVWKGNPSMAIHTYCGERDEFKLLTPNKMFSDTLAKYGIRHTYKQDPNGDHINSLITSLPQGINFLYQVMDTAHVRIPTRVGGVIAQHNWSVYPNPAKGRLNVSATYGKFQQLVVQNISGQKVLQADYPLATGGLNISALEKGVYFVSLRGWDGNTSAVKLIKQ